MLRDDAGHFADPHYWNVSRHRLDVPDNRPEGALDSIYVDQAGIVTDPKAFLLFNHSWVSDIWAYLTSPAGTTITLIPRTGASYNDLMTFFTDAADSLVTAGLLPPFSPRVRPTEPLAGLIGEPVLGWWKIQLVDAAPGDSGYVSGWGVSFGNTTSTPEAEGVAERFELMQNYPNPFNPATTISFSLPEEGHVMLVVYNLLGQEVATVVNGDLKAGVHQVQFHAAGIASGVYFYRLVAKDNVQVRKMMLLK